MVKVLARRFWVAQGLCFLNMDFSQCWRELLELLMVKALAVRSVHTPEIH